jgi:hypothetical protein
MVRGSPRYCVGSDMVLHCRMADKVGVSLGGIAIGRNPLL